MNNKGVTLIELLIVIVVLGIISAFAIPAVGQIITNTEKDAVIADAIAIKNAAEFFCASESCTASQTLGWDDLEIYVKSFSDEDYEETDSGDTATIAALVSGEWQVTLEKAGTGTTATDEWEYVSTTTPSEADRDTDVTDDDN